MAFRIKIHTNNITLIKRYVFGVSNIQLPHNYYYNTLLRLPQGRLIILTDRVSLLKRH